MFLNSLGTQRRPVIPFEGAVDVFVDGTDDPGCRAYLSRLLGWLAAPVLLERFDQVRRSAGPLAGSDSSLHDRFVDHLRAGGLDRVLTTYPELQRLLAHVSSATIAFADEVRASIAADEPRALLDNEGIVEQHGLELGLSEPHRGGRTVTRVDFADGRPLVYKPRPLTGEVLLEEALRSLGESTGIELRAMRVVARGDHGWTEYIDHEDCDGRRAVDRYYTRCGVLLALFVALGSEDMNRQNVIAAGEFPVIVDAETLTTPGAVFAADALDVRSTGFVPLPAPWTDDVDMSALGRPDPGVATQEVWADVGTNRIDRRLDTGRVPRSPSLPTLDGRPQLARDHLDAIVAGFATGRAALERSDLAHEVTERVGTTRLLARRTDAYVWLLRGSREPARLRSADVRREYLADALDRMPSRFDGHASAASAKERELADLLDGDVPVFEVAPRPPRRGPEEATTTDLIDQVRSVLSS